MRPGNAMIVIVSIVFFLSEVILITFFTRAAGVKRIMRGQEAKKVCSDIILVQVPTSYGKADLTAYRDGNRKCI